MGGNGDIREKAKVSANMEEHGRETGKVAAKIEEDVC